MDPHLFAQLDLENPHLVYTGCFTGKNDPYPDEPVERTDPVTKATVRFTREQESMYVLACQAYQKRHIRWCTPDARFYAELHEITE